MAKFKVGQWVRALVNWGSIEKGKVYQIPHLDNDGEPWFTSDGFGGWTDYLSLEEIEPWTPRVGDRVRMTKKVDGQKANCGATIVHNDGGKRQPFVLDLDEPQTWAHRGSGYAKEDCGWWVALDDIEPLPVAAEAQPAADDRPDAGGGFKVGDKIRLVKSAIKGSRTIGNIYEAVARNGVSAETSVNFKDDAGNLTWAPGQYFELYQPLQIKAGKFYKTRDGREVGPMIAYHYPDEWIVAHGDGNVWLSDGSAKKYCEGSYMSAGGTLTSEWFDAPASPRPLSSNQQRSRSSRQVIV